MKSMAQRRQALLDHFDKYEEMALLFSSIPQSPALWEEDDAEVNDLRDGLVERGLLEVNGYYYTTTQAGRDLLIAYINGEDDDDAEEPVEDWGYDLTTDDDQEEGEY